MKKHKRIAIVSAVVVLVLLICGIGGCMAFRHTTPAEQPAVAVNEQPESELAASIRADLGNPDITTVNVSDTVVFYSTVEVVGTKTITGGGCLTVADASSSADGLYILTLVEGADVTLQNINIDGQDIFGGVHVQEGAALTVLSEASVYYAVTDAANVLVEGECLINGGSLLTAGGNNVINKGTTRISDGVISGSGIGHQYSGVLNSGTLTMDGGCVEKSRTNITVTSGAVFTFHAGSVSESAANGVMVEEGGSVTISSADALIEKSGISGLYIDGQLEIIDATVRTSEETQLEIGTNGEVVIHDAMITRGYADGVYNAGSLTINNIEVSYVLGNGIVNRGDLKMVGGSVHDNDGEGIYNRNGGTASIASTEIAIYNNHTGVRNDADSNLELTGAQIYDNSAYSINNYGTLYAKNLTVSNSGSTSVYGNSGGYMELTDVIVNGTQTNHGIYLISGSTVKLENVTIKNTAGRGITNVGGTLTGRRVVILNSGSDGAANVTTAGTMELYGLYIKDSAGYNLQNAGFGSVMRIADAELGVTTNHNIRHNRGVMTLTNVTVKGTKLKAGSDSSVHGIYTTGDILNLNGCAIENTESGQAVLNRGTTIYVNGLTCKNINGYAIYNVLGDSDWAGDGQVYIDGLTVDSSVNYAVYQDTPGGAVVISNSRLTSKGSNNIIVNNRGTMTIESGVDMSCAGRAINNKGTMVINGGVIHDITPASSTIASAIYNVGTLTINDCEIYGNTAAQKGVIGNVSYEYDYDLDGTAEKLYGTLTINGGKFYNNKVESEKDLNFGGAVYVDAGTTAYLMGGYFYNNDAEKGNDIYNAGCTTLGAAVVGYDENGTVYTVDSMAGEVYTVNELAFAGDTFAHTDSAPMSVTLAGLELGAKVISSSEQTADALIQGILVNGMEDNWYLSYQDGSVSVWMDDLKYVCRIGEQYYYTFAAAVDSVGDGESAIIEILADISVTDVINIGDGTVKKHITIIDDGTARTISRGTDNSGRFFRVYAGSSLTLTTSSKNDGAPLLVLDGGSVTNKDAQFLYTQGTVTVDAGVVLQNNYNSAGGGAIMINKGTVTVNGGLFRNNQSGGHGGAIYVNTDGVLVMNGGMITGNQAASGKYAGGIYNQGNVQLNGGTVTGNTVGTTGEDVCYLYKDGSSLNLQGSAYVADIRLLASCVINVTGNLTTENVMTIRCDDAAEDRVVIAAGAYTEGSMGKFGLAEDSAYVLTQNDDGAVILKANSPSDDPVVSSGPVYNQTSGEYYDTLAEAVAAVADGGTATLVLHDNVAISACINIGDGTVKKHITIIDDGTARTISRGTAYTGRFFRVYPGSSLTFSASSGTDDLSMLYIDGGNNSGTEAAQFIYVAGKSNSVIGLVTINAGVVFENNTNPNGGGGVVNIANYGKVVMNGGLIRNNTVKAQNGGAFYVNTNGQLIIHGGTITANRVTSTNTSHVGGGIYSQGTLTINGGTITDNTVRDESYDVYCKKNYTISETAVIGVITKE